MAGETLVELPKRVSPAAQESPPFFLFSCLELTGTAPILLLSAVTLNFADTKFRNGTPSSAVTQTQARQDTLRMRTQLVISRCLQNHFFWISGNPGINDMLHCFCHGITVCQYSGGSRAGGNRGIVCALEIHMRDLSHTTPIPNLHVCPKQFQIYAW